MTASRAAVGGSIPSAPIVAFLYYYCFYFIMPVGKGKGNGKSLFFVILIAFAVISFWRGIWGLMDEYLFPASYQMSLWASVIEKLLQNLRLHLLLLIGLLKVRLRVIC